MNKITTKEFLQLVVGIVAEAGVADHKLSIWVERDSILLQLLWQLLLHLSIGSTGQSCLGV